MRHTILILLALLASAPISILEATPLAPAAQAPPAPADTTEAEAEPEEEEEESPARRLGGMRPYAEVVPDSALSDEGLFTVHRVGENWLFEIPVGHLGREILLQTRITRAATGTGFGGQQESSAVVRFERRENQILLRLVGHNNMAADSLPIYEAVRNSNFEPILQAFEIRTMADDSSSVVIDVGSFFRSDAQILGIQQSRRDQYQVRNLNADRTFIESVRSFPENVEVRRTVTWAAGRPPSNAIGGVLSLELGHAFVLLPEVPMTPRPWDERVGYFSVSQNDFGAEAQRVLRRTFVRRWRLEPSDPVAYAQGRLVDPVKPIIIYIDPATPERWRPWLKQGIEDWQEAFEAAGFSNAILAMDPPSPEEDPEFDPADARVSMIRYLASDVQNASGPSYHDPRSGEIIGTHIQWHHNVMNLVRNWYFAQTAAANPEARGLEFEDEVMGELIRYVAAHEVGHTLGLPHNMKGHSAIPVEALRTRWVCENGTSTSIMDYARFNYVAQPGDDTCFIPRIGPYDRWAIEWGYRVIPADEDLEAQRRVLNEWIVAKGDDPLYRFGDPSQMDPGSTQEALGDDPVRASDYGVANLQRIMDNLQTWTFREGDDYAQLRELYGAVIDQWNRFTGHVVLSLGGVDWTRRAQGQEGRPYEPVPAERQRAALDYLDRQVFTTPYWMVDPDLLYRFEGSGIQDRVRGLQVSALNGILNVPRMKRMIEQEALHGSAAYPLHGMLSELQEGIWRELDEGAPIDPFRRNLQRAYLNRMEALLADEQALDTDIAPLVRGRLSALQEAARLARDRARDEVTRLHLEDVRVRIVQILEERRPESTA